ncbi:RdgB/HAM1 family non-canonical purine NTP pyrophosphatase [Thauera sp. WB-2]|uniref:RdgB/HAM1 family non-canonical purine NTP pyrophosphatase n=1 Tax=Thauera sp. WB-2 TaxID=2897772 RepID=UPI0022DDDED6|nr:RdgB/HAM1 family non-canonical purine NTP pyrophosphatase [Thauera sp. WB-2]WBL64202.1 RdgB/HAM1 family non-canonical purine NTP pyrophosphatase [Thauera sp. WB-2]
MSKRLVLASNNVKKAAEMQALLAPLGIEVVPQSVFGVSEAEEPHPTFVENALAKARHAAAATGLPAVADDSGLCVEALGGAPGVISARFAGEPKSDARNNALLLEKLAHLTEPAQRAAYFYSTVVLVRHAEDPRPLIADGEWHGQILTAERGAGGFGYDPLFWLPDLEQTAAELEPALKNTLSHRGAAMRHLLDRLKYYPL